MNRTRACNKNTRVRKSRHSDERGGARGKIGITTEFRQKKGKENVPPFAVSTIVPSQEGRERREKEEWCGEGGEEGEEREEAREERARERAEAALLDFPVPRLNTSN